MNDIHRTTSDGYLEFSPGFFQRCMREYLGDPGLTVTSARYLAEVGVTATTRMKYTGITGKLLGLFHYEIEYTSGGGARKVEILVKSKTHYRELVQRLADVLVKGGIEVAGVADLLAKTELYNTHMKEINVFRMQKAVPALAHVLPVVYGTYVDDERQQYVVLEEFLSDAYVMQDYRDLAFWTRDRIARCVTDFAAFHSAFYARTDALVGEGWLGKTLDAATMTGLTPLWRAYAEKLRHFEGGLFDAEYLDLHDTWIRTLPDWWGRDRRAPEDAHLQRRADTQSRRARARDAPAARAFRLGMHEHPAAATRSRRIPELCDQRPDQRRRDHRSTGCGAHRACAPLEDGDRPARVARRMPPVDPGSARESDGLPAGPAYHAQPARHRACLPRLDADPALARIIALAPARTR